MLLEELIKEEREQALAEGRELGWTEGQISSILELLSYLGEVPEEIREEVSAEKDPETLKQYLRQASAAKNMADFKRFLTERKGKQIL